MEEERVKRQIAKQFKRHRTCCDADYSCVESPWAGGHCELGEDTDECPYSLKEADQILSIKGIRIESADQGLPEVPQYFAHDISISLSVFDTYRMGQQDMLKAGFIKCLKRREDGS